MSAESDLYAALSGAAAITSVVGSRIFADVRDQDSDVPAITYTRTGSTPYVSLHAGEILAEQTTLQVSCFASSREAVEAIGDNVYLAAITAGLIYQDRDAQYDPDTDLFITNLVFIHNRGN